MQYEMHSIACTFVLGMNASPRPYEAYDMDAAGNGCVSPRAQSYPLSFTSACTHEDGESTRDVITMSSLHDFAHGRHLMAWELFVCNNFHNRYINSLNQNPLILPLISKQQ